MFLGVAPNLTFIAKILSTVFKVPVDDVAKLEIRKTDLKNMLHGGKITDTILDILNNEIRENRRKAELHL